VEEIYAPHGSAPGQAPALACESGEGAATLRTACLAGFLHFEDAVNDEIIEDLIAVGIQGGARFNYPFREKWKAESHGPSDFG
jgi:hypothetical protein